jgi:HD-like signal output (HDOD) protein
MRTAALCKQFLTDRKRADEAFSAALVHEIGAFFVGNDDSHAEVSAYILQLWGLPFTIVEAVAFHHRPGLVTEGPRDVLAALHVADALIDGHAIDEEFIAKAGLTAELERWKAIAAAQSAATAEAAENQAA